jgi:nucleoside-diphosphate-sugar epimerase
MKSILITGGQGYIGQQLVSSLLEDEVHITVVDRNSKPPCRAQVFYPQDCELFFHQQQLYFELPNLADILGRAPQIDHVVHLAHNNIDSVEFDADGVASNYRILFSVLEYSRISKTPLLVVLPSAPLYPHAQFDLTQSEQLVKFYVEHHSVNAKILRLVNVFGPGELRHNRPTSFTWQIKNAIISGETVDLTLCNTNVQQYVHLFDAVQCIKHIILDCPDGMIFDSSNKSPSVTYEQIIETLHFTGVRVENRSNRKSLSIENKIEDLPNWSPKISVETHLYDWMVSGCPVD